MMDRSGQLLGLLSFSPTAILHGQIWRLVTFVFVPTNSGIWLLISLYFYYFVGSVLEREWGAGRFTIFYLSGMLLTIVYGFIVYFAAACRCRCPRYTSTTRFSSPLQLSIRTTWCCFSSSSPSR